MFFKVSGFKGELQIKNPANVKLHYANYLYLALLSILEN
jgi:hypothetical protein